MQEYFTEAIILDKEDAGEFDGRVFLFTEELGKIAAKATSIRKITSKLASHLEPLNLSKVRLVKRSGFQIADALSINHFPQWRKTSAVLAAALKILHIVKEMTAEEASDLQLWAYLKKIFTLKPSASSFLYYQQLLKILGFDPKFAICQNCGAKQTSYFFLQDMAFWCEKCLLPERIPFFIKYR